MENLYNKINDLMKPLQVEWAICGGDAIDLFVGKDTRLHKDIDIAVFWEDRKVIIQYFLNNEWQIFEPDHGLLREITSLDNDLRTEDNLWCIKKDCDSYNIVLHHDHFYEITIKREHQNKLDFIELLFNRRENGKFIYKRNKDIQLENYVQYTKNKIPFLAVEMVLLYKSNYIQFLDRKDMKDTVENYRHDFRVALPLLSEIQKEWLKNALTISYPKDHEWINEL